MEKRIVTLTLNPALDIITGISHVVPNQKLRCNSPKHEAGGGGINVSRAIQKLGGESLAIFPSGGSNGEILEQKLDGEDVLYRAIEIEDASRENITVFEGSTYQQFRFIMPGPNLSEEEYADILTILRELKPQPDFLVLSGSTPDGFPDNYFKKIIAVTDEMDSRVIVDTSGQPLKLAAEAGVYLVKPNMRELANLVGNSIEGEEGQIEAAQEIVNAGQAEVVIVSLGAGGALLVTPDENEHLRTPTVTIRSRLGVGDSMVAGVVLKLAQGETIRDAALYGLAAGAATVSTEGTELCSQSDTDHLYQRLKQTEEVG